MSVKIKDLTSSKIKNFILTRNWQGHVEIGDSDVAWLADELLAWLKGQKRDSCEACGQAHEVIVATPLGNICETCIEAMQEQAEDQREEAEKM